MAAAHTEFCANGYQGTTMAAVAARAKVAVQTVYFVFHTKIELLTEVFDTAVLGGLNGTPPTAPTGSWPPSLTRTPPERCAASSTARVTSWPGSPHCSP